MFLQIPAAPLAMPAAALPPWLRLRSAAAAAASTKRSRWRSPGTTTGTEMTGMGSAWEMLVKDMMCILWMYIYIIILYIICYIIYIYIQYIYMYHDLECICI